MRLFLSGSILVFLNAMRAQFRIYDAASDIKLDRESGILTYVVVETAITAKIDELRECQCRARCVQGGGVAKRTLVYMSNVLAK